MLLPILPNEKNPSEKKIAAAAHAVMYIARRWLGLYS